MHSKKKWGLALMIFGIVLLLVDTAFVLLNYTTQTGVRNQSVPILGGALVPVGLMPLLGGFILYSATKRQA